MKARSVVLVHVQKPMTYFGLPLQVLASIAFKAIVVFVVLIILKIVWLSFIAFVGTFCFLFVKAFKKVQKDHHIITVTNATKSFWGERKTKTLLRGQAHE